MTSRVKNICNQIQEKYGVSKQCASYLYYRALRSKRKDDKYMDFNVKLQNALVKLDKCLGVEWSKILFDKEIEQLKGFGIFIDEQETEPFSWKETVADEWTVVSNKKKSSMSSLSKIGLV